MATPEFAQRLAAASQGIEQPLCAYIDRRGHVVRVGVGSPRQTQIPPTELPRYGAERLCGLRCLATQLKAVSPSDATLTAMAIQRLDALALFNLSGQGFQRRGGGGTGYIDSGYLAHLAPHEPWTVSPQLGLDEIASQDFIDLVEGLEEEFRREFVAQQVDADHDRVLVVGVMTKGLSAQEFGDRLAEVGRLVDTAVGDVLDTIYQK